jgi:hypothetical protein
MKWMKAHKQGQSCRFAHIKKCWRLTPRLPLRKLVTWLVSPKSNSPSPAQRSGHARRAKSKFLSVSSPPGLGLAHAKGKRNPCEPSTVKEKALRDEASKMQSVSEKKPGVFIVGDGPLLGRAP